MDKQVTSGLAGKVEEIIKVIFENDSLRVERIESYGVVTKEGFWYDNDCDEWVLLERGSAVIELESANKSGSADYIRLKEGESYYIKASLRHRVAYTSNDCLWLCVYIKGKKSIGGDEKRL